jgi:hypothetical protein
MELKTYDQNLHDELLFDKVIKKGVRKIYYVSSGRNAWWSTWVKQYNSGCMHTTLDSAKKYAEKMRTNGSVFYIQEIPALVLEGRFISLIVTQINCQDVLQNYKPKSKDLTSGATHCHITANSLLCHAYNSFVYNSAFWDIAPPAKNSVLRLLCHTKLKDFDFYRASSVSSYKSESIGPNYYLQWHPSTFEAKNKSLARIATTRANRKRVSLGAATHQKENSNAGANF